jgi:hypothetical protein
MVVLTRAAKPRGYAPVSRVDAVGVAGVYVLVAFKGSYNSRGLPDGTLFSNAWSLPCGTSSPRALYPPPAMRTAYNC